jgi:transcriptional regulator with XRE-family HTH domain
MCHVPEASDAVDISELAALLRQRRKETGKSLREVAAETGVPFATLSRVEAGRVPDLSTFRNIVIWLGVPAERFFPTARVRTESTPDVIAKVLRDDPALSDHARDQLTSTISQMYTVLAVRENPVRVHLRSDKLFTPAAAELLGNLLRAMLEKLIDEETS